MIGNALCKNFQRLGLTARHAILGRHCSTRVSNVTTGSPNFICPLRGDPEAPASAYQPNLRAKLTRPSTSLDLGLPPRPASIGRIHEFPVVDRTSTIGEPPTFRRDRAEDSVVDAFLELPTAGTATEKRAVNMIVIRRRKMKKHKRKKLRKKMKFFWSKMRQRREMKREKAFHAELLAQIKKAESFDPESYVQGRFAILDEVRWPNKYRGVDLPESQVREFILRDREKRAKKFNKPRLEL